MGHDVVDDLLGSKDQPPAERQISRCRTAAPAAFGVADTDPCDLAANAGGERPRPPRQLIVSQHGKMVAHAARQMRGIAAHPNLAIRNRHRRRRDLERVANPMQNPQHRDDSALGKRNRPRQCCKPALDPTALVAQKPQPDLGWHAVRQHQFDPARSGIDTQPDPTRPRADPDRQRGAEIECERLPADCRDRQFARWPQSCSRGSAKTRHLPHSFEDAGTAAPNRHKSFSDFVLIPQAASR